MWVYEWRGGGNKSKMNEETDSEKGRRLVVHDSSTVDGVHDEVDG